MGRFKWRKWNNIIHRDIGYLAVGLTIIFAVSGIAVNHVADWNPNYEIVYHDISIPPFEGEFSSTTSQYVLDALKIDQKPKSTFRPAPSALNIYLENQTIEINLRTGTGRMEVVQERPLLYDLNFLHLNHAKKWWTWFSDLYAVALLFLALSGLFVLKGKNGLSGRGKWLTGIGFLFPLFFLFLYKYF